MRSRLAPAQARIAVRQLEGEMKRLAKFKSAGESKYGGVIRWDNVVLCVLLMFALIMTALRSR